MVKNVHIRLGEEQLDFITTYMEQNKISTVNKAVNVLLQAQIEHCTLKYNQELNNQISNMNGRMDDRFNNLSGQLNQILQLISIGTITTTPAQETVTKQTVSSTVEPEPVVIQPKSIPQQEEESQYHSSPRPRKNAVLVEPANTNLDEIDFEANIRNNNNISDGLKAALSDMLK